MSVVPVRTCVSVCVCARAHMGRIYTHGSTKENVKYTVWPEILAGRYFGGLLKICHLAEFTLAVEPVLAIMILITKWLIKRVGNLTGL